MPLLSPTPTPTHCMPASARVTCWSPACARSGAAPAAATAPPSRTWPHAIRSTASSGWISRTTPTRWAISTSRTSRRCWSSAAGRTAGCCFSVRCCRTRVWSRGCCRATWRRPKRCPWRRICVAGYCTRLDAGLLTNTRDVSAALLRLPRNRAYDWRPNSGQPPDLARQQAPTTLEVGEWSHKTLQNLRERSLIIEATPF